MTHPPRFIHQIQHYRNYCSVFIQATTDCARGISLLGRYPGFALTPTENEFAAYPPPTNYSKLLSQLQSPSTSAWLASVPPLQLLGEAKLPTYACERMFTQLSIHFWTYTFNQLNTFCCCPVEGFGSGEGKLRNSLEFSQKRDLFHPCVGKFGKCSKLSVYGTEKRNSWAMFFSSQTSVALKHLVFEITGILIPSFLSLREF